MKLNIDKKFIFVEFDVYVTSPEEMIDEASDYIRSLKEGLNFLRVYPPIMDGGSLRAFKKWVEEGHPNILELVMIALIY